MTETTFSLVLATVGRQDDVRNFLLSLREQVYRHFEVIIVDQNLDSRLDPVVAEFENNITIRHIRSHERGLSRARNIGLKYIQGDVVAFPDDDCSYPARLLLDVATTLSQHPEYDGITGRVADLTGKDASGRFKKKSGEIKSYNFDRRCTSASIFLRRPVVKSVGNFDETLGLGSGTVYQAGEDGDYILRCIAKRFRIHYDPRIVIIHPQISFKLNRSMLAKYYRYALAWGRVRRKHRIPWWNVLWHICRPLGGALVSIAMLRWGKACGHFVVFGGRCIGWIRKKDDAVCGRTIR